MTAASWTIALGLALLNAGGPTGRWLGQDGHDLASPSPSLEPNEYQDIHILLNGLPVRRTIERVELTADGSGIWSSDKSTGHWKLALVQGPDPGKADIFFESDRPEKGRVFHILVVFKGGATAKVPVRGGRANPNLRLLGTTTRAKWVGQIGKDLTAAEPGVGPDGCQDAQLSLADLVVKDVIKSVVIDAGDRTRWHAGLNPDRDFNAELVRDGKDPRLGLVYFQPDRDLAGRKLEVTIEYASGKHDTIAVMGGRTDPKLAMIRPALPKLQVPGTISGRWLGQDRRPEAKRGDVHVELAGLPSGRTIGAAVLSDLVTGLWVYRAGDQFKQEFGSYERPLVLRRGSDPSKADLYMTPYRDETDATLILRLLFEDGGSTVVRIKAGACDPFAGLPGPTSTSVVAKPGDDLNDLASRFGTVTLAGGTHRLSKPLVLERPIALIGEAGAILEFSQGGDEAPWTTAIKIHSGSTTLRDFSIRFADRVRWNQQVSYGPAVIGTTDNLDPPRGDPKFGLTFQGLDIATPPPSGAGDWEEVVRLMRLVSAQGGNVTGCTLYGGTIEFFGGPWQFVDNTYRGTPPGSFTPCVFGGHYVHDLLVRGNKIRPVEPSGKTWRFLVVTSVGHTVRVEDNMIEGVGPRDDDTIPSQNAPEIILTESYKLNFEGKLSELSSDGQLVTIEQSLGEAPPVGHLVSVLTGPHAGRWSTIAQRISASTYLVDPPLPNDATVISISGGFVAMRVERNRIDCRGGRGSSLLVLPGNHFGTLIRGNRLMGGGEAIRLLAVPSETPQIWGWSHAPCLEALVEGNILEDSFQGGILGVEHNQYIKSNVGRTYMTVSMKNNIIRWSDTFLRQHARVKDGPPLRGFTLGFATEADPGELLVTEQGDRLEAPASAREKEGVHVYSAHVNGRRITKKGFRLPASAPADEVSRTSTR